MSNYPNYRVSVEIFILHFNKVLLTRLAVSSQVVDGVRRWSVPAGKTKYDETPVQALLRECKEETNLDVEIIRELDTRAVQFYINDEKIYRLIFSYLVKPNDDDVTGLQLNHEHVESMWVDSEQVEAGFNSFEHDKILDLLRGIFADGETERKFNECRTIYGSHDTRSGSPRW